MPISWVIPLLPLCNIMIFISYVLINVIGAGGIDFQSIPSHWNVKLETMAVIKSHKNTAFSCFD